MARKAKDEPYHQMMKSRALTLFCPYEDCINHKKKAMVNIIFIRRYGTGENTEPVQVHYRMFGLHILLLDIYILFLSFNFCLHAIQEHS